MSAAPMIPPSVAMSARKERERRMAVMIAMVLGALVVGALLAVLPEQLVPYAVGLSVLSALVLGTLARPMLLLYAVIASSAVASALRNEDAVDLGATSMSISGLRWVFIAVGALFLLSVNLRRLSVPVVYRWFLPFLVWAGLRWVLAGGPTPGLKDLLFYALPPLIGVYAYNFGQGFPRLFRERILNAFFWTAAIPALGYAVMIPMGWVEMTMTGPRGFISPRPIALYLLIVVSLCLGQWRAWPSARLPRGTMVALAVALATILFTLSRMATLTAALLVVIAWSRGQVGGRTIIGLTLATVISVVAVLNVGALRDRFFHGRVSSIEDAYNRLNMAGRDQFWAITWEDTMRSPVIGLGPGTARLIVAQESRLRGATEYHPHNEYLQVLHDFGFVGLILLLLGWIPLLVSHRRMIAVHLRQGDLEGARWALGSFLCVVAVLVTAITDNTLHYSHVVAPAFIISAAALLKPRLPSAPPQQDRR